MISGMTLREVRKRRRLSQQRLAALSGVSQQSISALEQIPPAQAPSWDTAFRISRALHVRPETVFPVPAVPCDLGLSDATR